MWESISTLERFIEPKPQFKMVLQVDIGKYIVLEQVGTLRKKETFQEWEKIRLYSLHQKIRKGKKRKQNTK